MLCIVLGDCRGDMLSGSQKGRRADRVEGGRDASQLAGVGAIELYVDDVGVLGDADDESMAFPAG